MMMMIGKVSAKCGLGVRERERVGGLDWIGYREMMICSCCCFWRKRAMAVPTNSKIIWAKKRAPFNFVLIIPNLQN